MTRPNKAVVKIFSEGIRATRVESTKLESVKVKIGNNTFVELVNISDTGLAVRINGKLDSSEIYHLVLIFSEDSQLNLTAELAWSRSQDNYNYYGLKFVNCSLSEGFLYAHEIVATTLKDIYTCQHKLDSIDSEFKLITYEILEYLSKVKETLDCLEKEIVVESANTRKFFTSVLMQQFENNFITNLKKHNHRLDKVFSKVTDKSLRKIYTHFFRDHVGAFYKGGPYPARALKKPRGYAGDYEMMNQIYRGEYEGSTYFDILMHRYTTNETAALSVRQRKDYFKEKIQKYSQGKSNFAVGSLACGPAVEIIDFFNEVTIDESGMISFYLIDQDIHSLLNAKRSITDVILQRGLTGNVEYVPLSVKAIIEQSEEAMGLADIKFDLIYTAGLFDYLTQPVAKALTFHLVNYLIPGGRLLIGNFHHSNPTKTIAELATDWRLIHRSENEMLDLVTNLNVQKSTLSFDEHGIEMFLEIER
jgi:hypothetical protein